MLLRSSHSLCATALANTVRLGISLFNPFRFHGVIQTLSKVKTTADLKPDEIVKYMQAANRCLKDPSNVKLIPLSSVLDTLNVLRKEFRDSPVFESFRCSLIETIDSPSRLIELVKVIEKNSMFHDPVILKEAITDKLHLVPQRSPYRIALSNFSERPGEYLTWFVNIPSKAGLKNLSANQLVTIINQAWPNMSPMTMDWYMESIEAKLGETLSASQTLVSRVEFVTLALGLAKGGHPEIRKLTRTLIEKNRDAIDVLSPSQIIEVLELFSAQDSNTRESVASNLQWKLDRDEQYLSSISVAHIARLLELLPYDGLSVPVVMSRLCGALKRPRQVCLSVLTDTCVAFNKLHGAPWIEYPEFGEIVFKRITSTESVNQTERVNAIKCLLAGIGVTDIKVGLSLIDRLSMIEDRSAVESEVARVVMNNQSRSRVGNLVLSKLLSIEDSDFKKIVESLKNNKSIPLHARVYDLSIPQLVEIVDLVPNDRLYDLEMVSEAASYSHVSDSLDSELELLSKLSSRGLPCKGLVDQILKRSAQLAPIELVEVLVCCAKTRVVPSTVIDLTILISSLERSNNSIEIMRSLIFSLSTIGLLVDEKITSRIVDVFLRSCRDADTATKAAACGEVIGSLFVALFVPSEKQLTALVGHMHKDISAISKNSLEIIIEMNEILKNDILNQFRVNPDVCEKEDEWLSRMEVRHDFQRNIRLGQTWLTNTDMLSGEKAIVIARPMDMTCDGNLSQLFKFRVFLLQERGKNVTIHNWLSLYK